MFDKTCMQMSYSPVMQERRNAEGEAFGDPAFVGAERSFEDCIEILGEMRPGDYFISSSYAVKKVQGIEAGTHVGVGFIIDGIQFYYAVDEV